MVAISSYLCGGGRPFTTVQQVFIIEHLFYCNRLKAFASKLFSIGTSVENGILLIVD